MVQVRGTLPWRTRVRTGTLTWRTCCCSTARSWSTRARAGAPLSWRSVAFPHDLPGLRFWLSDPGLFCQLQVTTILCQTYRQYYDLRPGRLQPSCFKCIDKISVADPGCLSRIRIFSIPDPHQRIYVFYPKNRKISSGLFILDPDFLPVRIQGSKRHRIPDPDPQHWIKSYLRSDFLFQWFSIVLGKVLESVLYPEKK